MISEENKLKFIMGERIKLEESGITINAAYGSAHHWEFGSILKFGDKLFDRYSCVEIQFNGYGDKLFLSHTYNFEIQFERRAWDTAFHQDLKQSTRDQITEYCKWIVSEDGRAFVKRIFNMKVFT